LAAENERSIYAKFSGQDSRDHRTGGGFVADLRSDCVGSRQRSRCILPRYVSREHGQ
jgi:hypothetical protein